MPWERGTEIGHDKRKKLRGRKKCQERAATQGKGDQSLKRRETKKREKKGYSRSFQETEKKGEQISNRAFEKKEQKCAPPEKKGGKEKPFIARYGEKGRKNQKKQGTKWAGIR